MNFEAPVLLDLYSYFLQHQNEKHLLLREVVDPLVLPSGSLPYLHLIDYETGPPERFRWRLIGTHITQTLGRDSTGRYFDDLYNENDFHAISSSLRVILERPRGLRSTGLATFVDRESLKMENFDCPISDDGETVSGFLKGTVYSY